MTPAPRPVALAFGGLAALAAAMGIGRFVYTPILPPMAEALGISQGTAGWIASMNFLGYVVGAVLPALRPFPGSRRGWLLVAVALSAATTAAMGFADSTGAFMALRFVGGMASAWGLVFASTLVLERLAAAGRPGLSALHFAGVGTGMAVSAVVVATLTAADLGWRALWLGSGLCAALATGVVAWLVPDQRSVPAPATARGPILHPAMLRLVVAYGLFGFGYVITATFLVAIVRGSPGIRPLEPFVWLVVGLAAAPSVALWTMIAARIGTPRTFAIACVLEAFGVGASVLWLTTPGALLAALLLGGTFMGLTAMGLVHARTLARGDAGRTLAIMTTSFGTGQIIGPAFAGALHDATGSFLLPSLVAVGALLVAAGLVLAARERALPSRSAG